jgi:hypothetical protein
MQYGKPPREAIRALLDPSDENILAMMRQQQAAVDRAEYVAWRMTQLQTLTGTPSSFGQTIRSSPPGSHAP